MRDAELWARIEKVVLAPIDAFDPAIDAAGAAGATGGEFRAKSLVLAASNYPLSGQPKTWIGWFPQKGKPLSIQVKVAIMLELKRFLYLLVVSREELVPSTYVAAALTQFRDECVGLIKDLGLGTLTYQMTWTSRARRKALLRTIALRAEEFGVEDPEQIWPKGLSLGLQLVGWGALLIGFGLAAIGQFGDTMSGVWSLPFLALGGFLWATEGPWPLDLPFRRSFVASLKA